MRTYFRSKKFINLLNIPLLFYLIVFEINIFNKRIFANTKPQASQQDLFLYRQMGASYLCISSRAEVDFNKGLKSSSATFANVISGKHGGAIKELGNKKLDEKKLYNAGTFQIVGSALNICPENIPNKIKADYDKRLKQIVKESKK